MIELFILAAAAETAILPTVAGDFDCQAEVPIVIAQKDGKTELQHMGGVTADGMKFALTLNGEKARADWPKSPLNMNGKAKVIATGTDAGMAFFTSEGPCTFTQFGCATMVHYARRADGSLALMLHPTALISDQAKTTRTPFLVIVSGRCTPRKSEK